jgi:glycosyltransferase 2 family protein
MPWEKRAAMAWLQTGASVLVLAATLLTVGRGSFWQQLAHPQLGWLSLAAAILLVQFPILATRWCIFAHSLAVPLSFSRALSEYLLATFLNQVLPLGVLGDVTRVIRHARASQRGDCHDYSRAAGAVVLERASGQMGLGLVVLAVLPTWTALLSWRASTGRMLGALGLAVGAATVLAAFLLRRLGALKNWRNTARMSIRALVAPRMLALHLPLSLLLVILHTSAFFCIAHAFGFSLSFGTASRMVPLVLVATTLPLFLGGWGIREATVAALYHSAGLASVEGVSIAVVYGCLSLLTSLPGLWALRRRFAGAPLVSSVLPHEQAPG